MVKTYSFVEQLERGAEGEKILDEYFKQWYDVQEATISQQKDWKIDREFRRKDSAFGKDDIPIYVEYKTDDRTDKTGNLFIETWSNKELRRYGWAFTTRADIIVYYALPDTIYMIPREDLQEALPKWMKEYETRDIRNKTYTTVGIPVPTKEVVRVIGSKKVRRLA